MSEEKDEIEQLVVLMKELAERMVSGTPFQRTQLASYASNLCEWMNEKPEQQKIAIENELKSLNERKDTLMSRLAKLKEDE